MKELREMLIVRKIRPPTSYSSRKSYYGLNVSSNINLEPIDQLDGFLVAKYIQQLFGPQERFYAYVAGVYNALNARSPKEALKTAEKRRQLEHGKKELLNRVIQRLAINSDVLTTYDLWDDEKYWELVDRFFYDGNYDYMPDRQRIVETIKLREFPLEILGKMRDVVRNVPLWIRSGALYLPCEVAEAVWLKERYGVEWKIGPPSEEVYDQFIVSEGIGIIHLGQPQAIENGSVKKVMPYIGKSTQLGRFLFSDSKEEIERKWYSGDPSTEYVLLLADTYDERLGMYEIPYGEPSPMELIWELISLGKQSD